MCVWCVCAVCAFLPSTTQSFVVSAFLFGGVVLLSAAINYAIYVCGHVYDYVVYMLSACVEKRWSM